MKKIELKHLAPYLPYGVRIKYNNGETSTLTQELMRDTAGFLNSLINVFKPILRPLSDLTKEIEHNGEKFVPIDELRKMSDVPYSESFRFEDDGFKFTTQVMHSEYGSHQWLDYDFNSNNQYEMYSRLFEWHFDVFGLIDKGLTIDINTLNK